MEIPRQRWGARPGPSKGPNGRARIAPRSAVSRFRCTTTVCRQPAPSGDPFGSRKTLQIAKLFRRSEWVYAAFAGVIADDEKCPTYPPRKLHR